MTVFALKSATLAALLWNTSLFLLSSETSLVVSAEITKKEVPKGMPKGIGTDKKKEVPKATGGGIRKGIFKKKEPPLVKGMKPIPVKPKVMGLKKPTSDEIILAKVAAGTPGTGTLGNVKGQRMNRKQMLEKRKESMKNLSKAELKTLMDATNLRKRKTKGVIRKRESTLAQILFPGVAPDEYTEGEEMQIMVDLVDSSKTNIPFEYYRLPVCQLTNVAKGRRKRKNLGEKLMGKSHVQVSPYTLSVNENISCKKVCDIDLSSGEVNSLKRMIRRQYAINLSLDGLPVFMYDTNGNAFRGSPVGSKLLSEATNDWQFFYHNHFRFTVLYNKDEAYEGSHRIIGFRVKPISIKHAEDGSTCGEKKVINHKDTLLELSGDANARHLKVMHSYEVEWELTDTEWADRWDIYLRGRPDESLAHHMSIINSFMVVVFLASVLSVILIKALRKDIAVYNDLSGDADDEDETGWKLIHGDVFRPPTNCPMLLAVLVGTGAQLVVAVLCTLLLGLTNLLNPMQKGQALSNIVILYVFTGSVSGYVSARLFKFCGGKNWKINTFYTAAAFPGVLLSMFIMLNIFLALYGSAMAVSIWTIIAIFLLWTCISTPLVCIGSFMGYRGQPIHVPTRTNQIARVIPTQQPMLASPFTSFVIGGMPFSTVCIEIYFIMGAVWMHQYYYLMGYLFGGCILLAITCALLSTVLCYMRLCAEDHRWWWKSFFDSATSGFWLFMYSVWYLCTKLSLVGFLPVTVYLTYMCMVSVAFGLFCGAIGFMTSFLFTKTIYSAVKID